MDTLRWGERDIFRNILGLTRFDLDELESNEEKFIIRKNGADLIFEEARKPARESLVFYTSKEREEFWGKHHILLKRYTDSFPPKECLDTREKILSKLGFVHVKGYELSMTYFNSAGDSLIINAVGAPLVFTKSIGESGVFANGFDNQKTPMSEREVERLMKAFDYLPIDEFKRLYNSGEIY